MLSKMIRRLGFWKKACLLIILFVTTLGLTVSCFQQVDTPEVDVNYIFGPALPENLFPPRERINKNLIDLGRKLYYEERLSKNHDISCNTCHRLDNYGVDSLEVSRGHLGQLGRRNSPSVYHAAGHIAQFWDGRASTVEEQAKGPILNSLEMGMPSEEKALEVLASIPEYVEAFEQAFPTAINPLTYDNIGKAIGSFERGLVTPAPFDKYFAGDKNALSPQQKKGLNLFVDIGCATCHNGTYFGGHMYRKVGLIEPWPNQNDLGRYEVTKQPLDRMVFKVPSLRNVAETAPYFHDGLIGTLENAIKQMARNQLGKKLSDNQIEDMVAFLKSLTGEIPTQYIEEPKLPSSTENTPKPDPS
jgi:cytochrome c peroxidase